MSRYRAILFVAIAGAWLALGAIDIAYVVGFADGSPIRTSVYYFVEEVPLWLSVLVLLVVAIIGSAYLDERIDDSSSEPEP